MNTKTACKMAAALEGVTEKDHFGSNAFHAHKRIFATVWHEKKTVNLRLTPEQQAEFLELDGDAFSIVPNAFGKQGWTTAHLEFCDKEQLAGALKAAWETSARGSTKKRGR
jgi:hypothetical protein